MNAVLLTLLATLGGTDGAGYVVADGPVSYGEAAYAPADGGCATCGGHGKAWRHRPHGGWFGMMPQTCYNPTLGCYDGNRHNHRYPAFHGTYYRRPYNYRNVFDYPWHADLHEPTSHFAYNVHEQAAATIVVPPPAAVEATPAPVPVPVPVPVPDTMGQRDDSSTQPKSKTRSASFSKFGKFGK